MLNSKEEKLQTFNKTKTRKTHYKNDMENT